MNIDEQPYDIKWLSKKSFNIKLLKLKEGFYTIISIISNNLIKECILIFNNIIQRRVKK